MPKDRGLPEEITLPKERFLVGAIVINSEWAKTLLMLFKIMYESGKRCAGWDLIMECHDYEDQKYFEMLESIYYKK